VFLSNDCPGCGLIERPNVEKLAEKLGCEIRIRYFYVDKVEEYHRLVKLEQQIGDEGNELPVVFLGTEVLGGVKEIRTSFAALVERFAKGGGAESFPELVAGPEPPTPTSARDSRGGTQRLIYIAYFDSPGCKECRRVEYMLQSIRRDFPTVRVRRFFTSDRRSQLFQEAISHRLGVPAEKRLLTPAVFVGRETFIREEVVDSRIRSCVGRYLDRGTECAWEDDLDLAAAEDSLHQRMRSVGLGAVIVGGLIDGINPCAFATLILFVSYMRSARRDRRKLLAIGGAFIAAVFLSYFAVGMGLSELALLAEGVPYLDAIVTWAIILLCILLAVLSLRDAQIARRGQHRAMTLQLPHGFKDRIHRVFIRFGRTRYLVLGGLLLGTLISMLELVCTGQIYFPLIKFMASSGKGDRGRALLLLLVYNLCFVVPLLAILGAAYLGATSERLTGILKRNLAATKVATAFFFGALATLLIITSHHTSGSALPSASDRTLGGARVPDGREPSQPQSDPLCGPRSLLVAAGRLGVSLELPQLAEACRATNSGTTMLDLRNAAKAFGLQAEGVRLAWDDLVGLDCPAVLFVSGDHFCCADPRERWRGGGPPRVRVYDLPGATLWMTRAELEEVWHGEALVIRSSMPSGAAISGPVAQFRSTFADFGVVKPDGVLSHDFLLENVGSEPLRILGLRKSCGCSDMKASKTEIPPRETAKITMGFDPRGREGSQLVRGYVHTSDPRNQVVVLRYRGVIELSPLVAPYLFDFGKVARGQERTETVVITDRGDQTLKWTGGKLELGAHIRDVGHRESVPETGNPTFELSYVLCSVPSPGSRSERSPGSSPLVRRATAGDCPPVCRMMLACRVPESAPYGHYFGMLKLSGQRQSGERVGIAIPVVIEVTEDLYAEPSSVCFGVMRTGEVRSRIVKLERRSTKPLQLVSCQAVAASVENPGSGSVQPESKVLRKGDGTALVELSLKAAPGAPRGGSLLSGRIAFSVAGEPVVHVPWMGLVEQEGGPTRNKED